MITSKFLPVPGRFLISEPFMDDENFQRTVVLLVEHGPNGSLGFVLNRQLDNVLTDVIKDHRVGDNPIFLGGPVEQDTLHYVHRRGEDIADSREVIPGLFWGGDFETIREMLFSGELTGSDIRFFVGYSGWAAGQLHRELRRKSWIVAPEHAALIFQDDHDAMWQEILRSMGPKYQVLSNYPIDPKMN